MTRQEELHLQLQGTRPCWAGENRQQHADAFNAYDIGLYCEDSDCSDVSILQPVPSLPGLSVEPTTASGGTVKLTKQQGPAQSSSISSFSPTKHQAWRQAHVPRPVGGGAGKLSQPLPVAGKLATVGAGQHHQPNSSTAFKAAASTRQDASKHSKTAIKHTNTQSKGMPAGCNPGLKAEQSAYGGTEHLTMIQVPEGVVTGVDAVRFFCSGAGKPGDLVFCNLARRSPRRSSYAGAAKTSDLTTAPAGQDASTVSTTGNAEAAATLADIEAGFYGDSYNPYDLRAVPQQQADKQQHWVVSYHGATHMRQGEPPDLTPHPEWLRQSELFSVLKGMPFFQQWRVRSAFGVWKQSTLTLRFQRRAKSLEASLLCNHSAVRLTIQEAHWLCLHLTAAAVPQPAPRPAQMQPRKPFQAAVAAVAAAQVLHNPAAAPAPGAETAGVGSSVSTTSSSSGSSSSQPGSSADAVWQRGSTYGQWRLVQQGEDGTPAAHAPQTAAASRCDEAPEHPTLSAAGASALVDELAHAAKGLLPQLQSRCSPAQQAAGAAADAAPSRADREQPGIEKQMQAACAHSSKLLKDLCDALQPEAVVTLPDLEGWKESTAAVTLKILGSLHTRLQASMAALQQQLAGELGARQQAAEAKQQAVFQAGKKPPLPWNVPVQFNLAQERRDMHMLLDRVARCLNVLVTSHAAQLASAATAHLLSSLLRPVDPVVAQQLCAQQQQPRLRSASCAGAVRLRVHAEVHQEAAGL